MKFNLDLKYNSKLDLNLNPQEFKNRCESLNIETSIIRNSFKKRQLGLLLKHMNFKTNYDFEIRKTGDSLNPFKSGRGIINGRLEQNDIDNSTLLVKIKPNYNEFAFNIFIVIILILNLAFGQSETKYIIAAGMTGFLIFGLIFQIWFLKRNLERLRIEFFELMKMIK